MSSKKKLVISLSVAAAVLVAAIIAIVAVFAFATQTVQSSLTVKFTATDVACKVTGGWAIKDATAAEGEQGTFAEVIINAKDVANSEYTMNASPAIPLTSARNYVDLTYTFENTGSRGFSVKLVEAITDEDITATYYDGEDGTLQLADIMGTEEATNPVICEAGAGETVTVKVRLTVNADSFAEDFEFATTIQWQLDAIVNQVNN